MEELLNPRHPLDEYHQAQLEFLRSLPEEMRRDHARLFRLGNAAYRYQQQAEDVVTEDDYRDWLTGLPETMRRAMEGEGFEKCKTTLPLRRHALERRDLGYDAFLQALLSPEDWAFEREMRASTPNLDTKQ